MEISWDVLRLGTDKRLPLYQVEVILPLALGFLTQKYRI